MQDSRAAHVVFRGSSNNRKVAGLSPTLTAQKKIGELTAGGVAVTLHRPVVVKKELSQKAKLSIYRPIYVPTLLDVFWCYW